MAQWKQSSFLARILAERKRQDQLKVEGRFQYTAADPELNDGERLAILLEEMCEVAKALKNQEASRIRRTSEMVPMTLADLETELVHVAAVSCAWFENLIEERIAKGEGGKL